MNLGFGAAILWWLRILDQISDRHSYPVPTCHYLLWTMKITDTWSWCMIELYLFQIYILISLFTVARVVMLFSMYYCLERGAQIFLFLNVDFAYGFYDLSRYGMPESFIMDWSYYQIFEEINITSAPRIPKGQLSLYLFKRNKSCFIVQEYIGRTKYNAYERRNTWRLSHNSSNCSNYSWLTLNL